MAASRAPSQDFVNHRTDCEALGEKGAISQHANREGQIKTEVVPWEVEAEAPGRGREDVDAREGVHMIAHPCEFYMNGLVNVDSSKTFRFPCNLVIQQGQGWAQKRKHIKSPDNIPSKRLEFSKGMPLPIRQNAEVSKGSEELHICLSEKGCTRGVIIDIKTNECHTRYTLLFRMVMAEADVIPKGKEARLVT